MNIEKTLEALRSNRFEAYFAKSKEDACKLALSFIPSGATVSSGGSVTLNEIGIIDAVKNGNYGYIDRYAPGLSADERQRLTDKSMTCDVFLTSSNAITENGELYNVDGNCNRVAAMLYGPKNVIVIAGKNKIVSDFFKAVERVKRISAPLNAKRLSCQTYCNAKGACISEEIGSGCSSNQRICSGYSLMSYQRSPGRVKVIIVDDTLGY